LTFDLLNIIMRDGSRHFGDLPQTASWYALRDHVARITGAEVTGFVTDHVTEAWIDFTYKGHRFSVNDQYGDYWFFVEDPACPNDILNEVLFYCSLLLLTKPANPD
jgi:hypothetical protein